MAWYTTADARRDAERQSPRADHDDPVIHVCQSCGSEALEDQYGKYCPFCGTDVEEHPND